jgi:hypothetical protein
VDTTFITGVGAVVAAVIVFCGGIWLLLVFVMGARLAYFVTASVTLAFLLIMAIVWSFTQLGPVGQLPEYDPVAIGEEGDVDFSAAGAYPNEPWLVPNEEEQEEQTKASEAESAATDALEAAITEGRIDVIESVDQAQIVPDSTRLLTQDDREYAAVMLEPLQAEGGETAEPEEPDPTAEGTVLVVMSYDPGNPLGMARMIAVGTFIVLALHLFGLSRAEGKARRLAERTA